MLVAIPIFAAVLFWGLWVISQQVESIEKKLSAVVDALHRMEKR